VRLWDVTSGQKLETLRGHKGEIYSVVFSPVDSLFASSGQQGEVLLWRFTSVTTPTPQPGLPINRSGLIVFYSERDGDAEIYLMNPDGSDQRPLTDNNFDDMGPTWSPDGMQIVFESDRDDPHPRSCFPNCNYNLYVMEVDGSNQRRLTDLPGAEWHADWSPDGKSLVFTAGDIGYGSQGIYIVSLDNGDPQPLLVDEFNNDAPDWSPDGKEIAFSSNRDGNLDIFIMNADGGGIHKVVDTGMNDYFPDWSPDGRQIAFFAVDWPATRQDIFTMNADGSNLLNLTNTPRIVDEDPKWSPDGSKILFQSNRDGNFEIYVMNSDGSQPQNLTRDLGRDYVPDWRTPEITPGMAASPSSKIAFVSVRDGNGEIYVMDSDGSNPQRLTHNSVWDGLPDWSPDGTQIAYYSYLGARSWVIKIMNKDGSNQRQLTKGGSCDAAPKWSPDGLWIAFTVDASCDASQRQTAVIGIDGQNFHLITQNESDNVSYAWSPDGSQLLLSSNRDGDDEIYTMNADGSNLVQLTNNDFTDYMPSWSPDGQRIAFVSNREGNDEIYVMDVTGSNLVRLTNEPADDWFPTWSADGVQLLFNSWRGDGDLEVYIMDRDGKDIRQLTDSPGEDFNAVWQP